MSILSEVARLLGVHRQPIGETAPPARSTRADLPQHSDAAANSDILAGYRFCATMQLRTPLRVITRHGEVHAGLDDPPIIAREAWEGIWLPQTKSWRDLGLDLPELRPTTMASDVGPIPADGGDYLAFLLAVRRIVEGRETISDRRSRLSGELSEKRWSTFVRKLGGKRSIVDRFFPPFTATIPGVASDIGAALRASRLTTPAKLSAASDAALLSISGIGPAKVKSIRAACVAATSQADEFTEAFHR